MNGRIVVGSRESRLAVVQSMTLVEHLKRALPGAEIELLTMKTTGDRILDRTLDEVGGKGLFVKELDLALRAGRADLTVHSLKDMPMEVPGDLPILCCSAREDPRDVLVLPEGKSEIDPGKPIGTSSMRRALQIRALYPNWETAPIRGNLQTRLNKLDAGQYGALVLAAAGLKRLGLTHRISRYFSPGEIIPAAGQGILAVQGRRGEDHAYLVGYGSADAAFAAIAERAFVRALDGGCSSPICAYAEVDDGRILLTGLYFDESTGESLRGTARGSAGDARRLAEALAAQLKSGKGGALS